MGLLKAAWNGACLEVRFSDRAEFLGEYRNNLAAAGLFVVVTPQPALHAEVDLKLLVEGESFALRGQVVMASPQGVGLQFRSVPEALKQAATRPPTSQVQAPAPTPVVTPPPPVAPVAATTAASHPFKRYVPEVGLLQGTAQLPQGSLYRAVMDLVRTRATAQLSVRGEDIADRFKLVFEGGKLCYSAKYIESRDVAPMLKKYGAISEVQMNKGLALAAEKSITVMQALAQIQAISEQRAEHLLKVKLLSHDGKIFALERGQYSMAATEASAAGAMLRVDGVNLPFRGILAQASAIPIQTLETAILQHRGAFPTVEPSTALALTQEEQKLWESLMEGKRTVAEVISVSPFKRQETYGYLLALAAVGALKFAAQALVTPSQMRHEALEEFHAEFVRGNAFEQLGIHWSHHPSGITAAWQTRVRLVEAFRQPGVGAADQAKIDAMLKQLKENRDRLEATTSRRDYRKQIIELSQIDQAADMLYQKAQMLMMRAGFTEAKQALESCVDLAPGNKTYQELLQRVTVLAK